MLEEDPRGRATVVRAMRNTPERRSTVWNEGPLTLALENGRVKRARTRANDNKQRNQGPGNGECPWLERWTMLAQNVRAKASIVDRSS
jgi:hypothetical protein